MNDLTCKDCKIQLEPVAHNIYECPTCGQQFDVDMDDYIQPTVEEAIEPTVEYGTVGHCPQCNARITGEHEHPVQDDVYLCPICSAISLRQELRILPDPDSATV